MWGSLPLSPTWRMHADFPLEGEATALGDAVQCLTALSRLHIERPTEALVAAFTPHLPPLYLKSLTLNMSEDDRCTEDSRPVLHEFCSNALHLKSLIQLTIRACNLSSPDVASLTALLHGNPCLEDVSLSLVGKQRQPLFEAALETEAASEGQQAAPSEPSILEELCAALRVLPLRTLTLEVDSWTVNSDMALFKPTDSGLATDECWKQLKAFSGSFVVPGMRIEERHLRGDLIFRALSSAEHLETIRLNRCHFTDDTFQV
jgi:hypothetical protein